MPEVVFISLLDHGDDEDEEHGEEPAGPVHRRVLDDVGHDECDEEIHVGYPPKNGIGLAASSVFFINKTVQWLVL